MYRSVVVGVLALGFAGFATRGSAAGLESERLRAHVPFAFEVGDTRLPPGDYVLRQSDEFQPELLELRSHDARHALFFFVDDAGSTASRAVTAELIFDRRGDDRFLRAIRLPDGAREVLPSSRDEIAKARETAGVASSAPPAR